MKRHLFMAVALATALCSCQHIDLSDDMKKNEETGQYEQTKAFTFHLKGDFTTSFEEMTRAAVRLENDNTAGITDIWVLDYQDGKLLQQVHQVASDADFGHPQMNLTYGHHDVNFIASKGTDPTLTASAISWGRVKDTFVLDYPVDVAASTNGNRAPELKRVVSGVTLAMTDNVPSNAKSITMEYDRSQSLALPSLVPGTLSVSGVTNDIPASWVGQTGTFSVYTLCPTDEFTTDVHVVVTAKDGTTISDFTIPDVSMKKNRMTTLTGECFGRGSGFSVAVDATWDDAINVEF